MTREELAKEIALGLILTEVEGPFDTVVSSSDGDYPSIGCSCWEGPRADELLSMIPGGDKFAERSMSDLEETGDIEALEELLGSVEGIRAQKQMLTNDALEYVDILTDIEGFDDSRYIIYAGIWCPTSHYTVAKFIKNRMDEYNMNKLEGICDAFYAEYAHAAGCDEYEEGYQNRANNTYDYVSDLDLSEYGVPPYTE